MPTNWDYKNENINSTFSQINRQKSARNLCILEFEPSIPQITFFDIKRNQTHTATLEYCDCVDFNRRKTFSPCMHIYRVATELGLLEAKYLDRANTNLKISALNRLEKERLQNLIKDDTRWGSWPSEIHISGMQKTRQYRAYLIFSEETEFIKILADRWVIHGYQMNLSFCSCGDFADRQLPCKHIYAAALYNSIQIPFSHSDFQAAKTNWKLMPLYLGSQSFTFAEYEENKFPSLNGVLRFLGPKEKTHNF